MMTVGRTESRREFFRSLARYAVLGGIGLGGVLVARRRSHAQHVSHVCGNQGICRGCPQLAGCILPQAQSIKTRSARVDAPMGTSGKGG